MDWSLPQIILASESPRRRELLADLGLRFGVQPADVDESAQPDESPPDLARRLSLIKAQAIAREAPGALVIAADTLVVLDGEVLNKPASPQEARAMLDSLRGREHAVLTGLTLCHTAQGRESVQLAATPVVMRHYSEADMHEYICSGDPMDKAGGYAIQHAGFHPVEHLKDCYANVVGLPLCHLYRVMRQWGLAPPVHPLAGCPWPVQTGACSWAEPILSGEPA